MEKDFIESNGEKIYFYVQRKNVKNINLKVNIDKKVTLSIPMKMSLDKAKEHGDTTKIVIEETKLEMLQILRTKFEELGV